MKMKSNSQSLSNGVSMIDKIKKELELDVKKIAYLAIYVALIMVLTFVPYTGYILIGPISITIIPAFVVLGVWTMGLWGAITTGLAFGISSYIQALLGWGGVLGPLVITHPELVIVPRIVMALTIFVIIKLLGQITPIKFVSTTILGFMLNTTFFLISNEVVNMYSSALPLFAALMPLIYVNVIVEVTLSPFIGYVLYRGVKEAMNQLSKDNSW